MFQFLAKLDKKYTQLLLTNNGSKVRIKYVRQCHVLTDVI